MNIVVAAYQRRRGWLAYHSGGAVMAPKVKLEDFMGTQPRGLVAANDVGRSLDLWDAVWAAKGLLVDG